MKIFPFVHSLIRALNLQPELDEFDNIHASIEKDLIFKGSNLWILVIAIVIASVGLNMNSAAVVIGAMLISPLMGPINGIGYSIATYNFPMFRSAVKNFTFSVIASLIASTAYFAISPISVAHSEILARTSPTIYDVMIAFFGGLAGIMAISNKKKGNVIPGVAIATALMPPLCTAGYGLATGQFSYFFGAFYLFTINSVFIAIAALLISQILRFPIRFEIDEKQKKKINNLLTAIIILVLIPSIYLGYRLVQKEEFTENAHRYINSISVMEGNYLLKSEVNPKTKSILLVYGGNPLTEAQKEKVRSDAQLFSLKKVTIDLHDGFSFDFINEKNSELESAKAELNRLAILLKQKEATMDSLTQKNLAGQKIFPEIKALFPQIIMCTYGLTYTTGDSLALRPGEEIFIFKVKSKNFPEPDKEKLEHWLKARQQSNRIKVFYEFEEK